MTKKRVLSIALIVIMIAILSFSSLAWFTDADKATNDFKINGAGTEDPDDIFSVDVKENVDGEDEPVDDMDFEEVLPGDEFKKEAYLTNTGAYDQYIRVIMTVTDWDLIKDVVTIKMDEAFWDNWQPVGSVGIDANTGKLSAPTAGSINEDGELVFTLYLKKKLAPGETVQIMDLVSVSVDATQEDFAAEGFADGFQIKFDADAAQTENILSEYAAEEWMNARATFEALA